MLCNFSVCSTYVSALFESLVRSQSLATPRGLYFSILYQPLACSDHFYECIICLRKIMMCISWNVIVLDFGSLDIWLRQICSYNYLNPVFLTSSCAQTTDKSKFKNYYTYYVICYWYQSWKAGTYRYWYWHWLEKKKKTSYVSLVNNICFNVLCCCPIYKLPIATEAENQLHFKCIITYSHGIA